MDTSKAQVISSSHYKIRILEERKKGAVSF